MTKERQDIIEGAVAQALHRHLPRLQAEIDQSVLAEWPTPAAVVERSGKSPMPGGLARAIVGIHAGTTQKEMLWALLDVGTYYAARVALFVGKGGGAGGWQPRGLGGDDFRSVGKRACGSAARSLPRIVAGRHRYASQGATLRRLLVDEIKRYNQAKVNEGRRNEDLVRSLQGRYRKQSRDLPEAL